MNTLELLFRVFADLLITVVILSGAVTLIYLPEVRKAFKDVGGAILSIAIGWAYDAYLVLVRLWPKAWRP